MIESRKLHSAAGDRTDTSGEVSFSSKTIPTSQQLLSSFFSILPLEIRLEIYRHLWAVAGSTQHVYTATSSALARLSHCPCISDPNAEDKREIEVQRIMAAWPVGRLPVQSDDRALTAESAGQRDEIDDWKLRNASIWCHHWTCEEGPPILRPLVSDEDGDEKRRRVMVKEFSPFLGILLTCKRMHQEAIDSIYHDTTFSFIGSDALSRFLTTTPAESLSRISVLHLVWSAPTKSYMDPENERAMAAKMQWVELWEAAATHLSRLKELRIWMYPRHARDLMPHEDWFRPLHQFKHVPRYDISLRWFKGPSKPDDGPLDFLEGAPFTYERIPPLLQNPLYFDWSWLLEFVLEDPLAIYMGENL